jgi:hypothetical protein
MRPRLLTAIVSAAALASAILACAAPAQAGGYGVYSGAGWNPAYILPALPPRFGRPLPLPPRLAASATFGTAANPAPLTAPALLFEIGGGVRYNKPAPLSGTYRVIPLDR